MAGSRATKALLGLVPAVLELLTDKKPVALSVVSTAPLG